MKQSLPSTHHRYRWLVCGLLAVFVGLSLYVASQRPLWKDEAFSAYVVQSGYSDIFSRTGRDVHPPLYYLLLKAWTTVFGHSQLGLRSLSIVLGLVLAASIWGLLRKLGAPKPALIAILVVLLPASLRFIDDARMYPLAASLATLATLVFWLCLQRDKPPKYLLALYCLLLIGAFYTVYLAVVVILGHFAYYFYANWQKGLSHNLKRYLATFWPVLVGLSLGILPYLGTFLSQRAAVQSGYWVPTLDGSLPLRTLIYLISGASMSFQTMWAYLASALVVGLGGWCGFRLWRRAQVDDQVRKYILLLLPMLGLIACLIVMSIPPLSSLFEPRFLAPLLPLFFAGCLVLGLKASRGNKKFQVTFVLIIGLLLTYTGGSQIFRTQEKGVRQIVAAITPKLRPGDAIIAGSVYQAAETYYYLPPNTPMRVLTPPNQANAQEAILVFDQPNLRLNSLGDITAHRAWLILDKNASLPSAPGLTLCGTINQAAYRAYCLQKAS